jgi:acyl carrier protein
LRSGDAPGRFRIALEAVDMLQDEVVREITTILVSIARVDPTQVMLDKSFANDLGIDSITMVKVVVAIEDRFGAIIPDEEWSRFSTVGDLVVHLEQIGVVTPS